MELVLGDIEDLLDLPAQKVQQRHHARAQGVIGRQEDESFAGRLRQSDHAPKIPTTPDRQNLR
jgi:hypothetical protein